MPDNSKNPALQPLKNAKHEAVLQVWIAATERVWWKAWKAVYSKSSRHAAETSSSRLLKNVEFCARRDALLQTVADQVVSDRVMSEVEVLEELSKLGRSSIKNCIVRGDLTTDVIEHIADMTEEHAACIKALVIDTYTEGGGDDAREVKRVRVELHDKRGPLRDLAQHYGLLTEKHELTGKGGEPLIERPELTPTEIARRIAFVLAAAKRNSRKPAAKPAKAK